jgi:hypothetical protein
MIFEITKKGEKLGKWDGFNGLSTIHSIPVLNIICFMAIAAIKDAVPFVHT